MKRVGVPLGLVVVTWAAAAAAQVAPEQRTKLVVGGWEFSPVVEARLRAEVRDELGRQSGVLVERARLGVNVERDSLSARVVMQEAGVLGAGSDLTGGPVRFTVAEPYELWGQWQPGCGSTFLRVGRQPIVWGEGRLLGTNDWAPTGRALDAARVRIGAGRFAFELLGATLTNLNVPSVAPYGELLGARAQAFFDRRLAVEAYALARLAQDNPVPTVAGTARGRTYTGALRTHGAADNLKWGVEAAYQGGYVDELGKDRAAWASAGHVAYAWKQVAIRPELRLGFAFASGDRGGSKYRGFDPLLPDVHQWHGAMSLFAWSNEAEGNVRLSAALGSQAEGVLEYRYARLAEPGGSWLREDLTQIGAAPDNTDRDLGHEVDLAFAWSSGAGVDLSAGYSVLALGAGGRAIASQNQLGLPQLSHFAYAQATLIVP